MRETFPHPAWACLPDEWPCKRFHGAQNDILEGGRRIGGWRARGVSSTRPFSRSANWKLGHLKPSAREPIGFRKGGRRFLEWVSR
jgi:hypothetical protein